MKFIYLSILWLLAINLGAQDVIIQKGNKTKVFKAEKLIHFVGANAEYEKFIYSGKVIDNSGNEIKYSVRTARVWDRTTGKREIRDYRDSTNWEVITLPKKI